METIIRATNKTEFRTMLRTFDMPGPEKLQREISTLRCWGLTRWFDQMVPDAEDFTLLQNPTDPPDFVLTADSREIGIEVTTITQQRFELWMKRRDGGNPTATFLGGRPDSSFHEDLKNFSLPGDGIDGGWVPSNDIESAYHAAAKEKISEKGNALCRYRAKYDQTVLLATDQLTHAESQFQSRAPIVARIVRSLSPEQRFDFVVLVENSKIEATIGSIMVQK